MAFDPYTLCPGGTGKKIKFCCADLLPELQKIDRMLDGEQVAGSVEHLERIEKEYPHRPCLLALKTELQMAQKQFDPARQTIAEFLQHHPTNPVALANDAMLLAMTGEADRAVSQLQIALEQSGEEISPRVYEALGVVANMLLAKQKLPAARAHFLLQAGLGGEHDQRALTVLMRMNSSAALPTLFKEDLQLLPAQANLPEQTEFNAALEKGRRAAWQSAEREFAALLPKAEKSPELWRNLALLRSWLGNNEGAAQAWRTYATLDVPLDSAVEAEATAQLLEPDPVGDPLEVMTVTYPIRDYASFETKLSADKRASRLQVDLSQLAEEGSPPPRGAYFLLDRPLARNGSEITRTEVPNVYGQFFVFGKETDREARVELIVVRDRQFDAAKQALAELGGDSLAPATGEEVSSHTSAMQNALTFNWHFPDDTPPALREKLVAEQQRSILLEGWPQVPMRLFGGKTPRDVAADPAQKIKILAAILNLELSATEPGREEIYNQLRSSLGLPSSGPLEVHQTDLREFPLARLHRLAPKTLNEEQLVAVYSRAVALGITAVAQAFGREIISRGDKFEAELRGEIYLHLARTERDTQQALTDLDAGRKLAEASGQSSARWDLEELAIAIEREDIQNVSRLMDHIAREHRTEPGVAQALYRLLMDAGIVDAEGRMRMPIPAASTAPTAPAANEIWTPGAAAQPGGEKPKLWMPGME